MFEDLEEPQGPILEGNRDYQVLTLVSTKEFPLNLIGTPKEQQHRCMFEEYTEDVWSISDDGTEVIRYHIHLGKRCSILLIPRTSQLTLRTSSRTGKPMVRNPSTEISLRMTSSGLMMRTRNSVKPLMVLVGQDRADLSLSIL